jgi:hypothetical protein
MVMMFPLWSRITSRFTDSTSNDGGGETLSVGEVDEVLSLVDSGDPLPVQDATKTTIGMTQRGALRHIEHQPTGAELTLTGGALSNITHHYPVTAHLEQTQLSHPIPSLSPSKPCGSGPTTSNRRYGTSEQFRSGGGGAMHTVG